MVYKSMKKAILVFVIMLLGCGSKHHNNVIKISLADSGRSLEITGIEADILQEINRDTVAVVWQTLIPVYRMPVDTDMKDFQRPQPGKYVVNGSSVQFKPDTPFTQHAVYFVRYYQYGEGNTEWDYIKQQKRLGKTPYIDLIFKR
jgi:hypothetical protein